MIIYDFFASIGGILTTPQTMLLACLGVFLGVVLGALPGISSTMAIAILLPVSFGLPATDAIVFLLSVFIASVYGGSISAILINIPGTPAAIVTQLDGYPMMQAGRGGQALKYALYASTVGGLIGMLLLIVAAPMMAKAAMSFRSPEFAVIAMLGLVMLALSSNSPIRGILVGLIGMLVGMVGFDTISDVPRFDLGTSTLQSGIDVVTMMVGIFGLTEVMKSLFQSSSQDSQRLDIGRTDISLRDLFSRWKTMLRGSSIGAVIGTIPAIGSAVAVSIAYAQEARLGKDKESFGKGNPNGVLSPESANSSSIGGSLIPMLTLGVPGDTITAVLMGALLMHGLRPGPLLFKENPGFFADVYAALSIGIILTLLIGLLLLRPVVMIMRTPSRFLFIGIALLCVVGSFAIRNNITDVYIMVFFGCIGYILHLLNLPAAPLAFGFILGPILEENLRRSLMISGGSWSVFIERPISLALLIITVFLIALPLQKSLWKKLNKKRNNKKIKTA